MEAVEAKKETFPTWEAPRNSLGFCLHSLHRLASPHFFPDWKNPRIAFCVVGLKSLLYVENKDDHRDESNRVYVEPPEETN